MSTSIGQSQGPAWNRNQQGIIRDQQERDRILSETAKQLHLAVISEDQSTLIRQVPIKDPDLLRRFTHYALHEEHLIPSLYSDPNSEGTLINDIVFLYENAFEARRNLPIGRELDTQIREISKDQLGFYHLAVGLMHTLMLYFVTKAIQKPKDDQGLVVIETNGTQDHVNNLMQATVSERELKTIIQALFEEWLSPGKKFSYGNDFYQKLVNELFLETKSPFKSDETGNLKIKSEEVALIALLAYNMGSIEFYLGENFSKETYGGIKATVSKVVKQLEATNPEQNSWNWHLLKFYRSLCPAKRLGFTNPFRKMQFGSIWWDGGFRSRITEICERIAQELGQK